MPTDCVAAARQVLQAHARATAHELGNLLTGLGLSLELLQTTELTSLQRRYVHRCLQICDRLGEQKNILGVLGAHDAAAMAWLDTRAMLAGAVAKMQRPAAEVSVTVAAGAERVWAQATGLEEALVQLLRNAADAGPMDAAPVPIALRADVAKGHWRLQVADEGPGPPVHLAPKFGRAPVSTKPRAAGMGLLRVALIVEEIHGGHFALTARRPRGALATICLPSQPQAA